MSSVSTDHCSQWLIHRRSWRRTRQNIWTQNTIILHNRGAQKPCLWLNSLLQINGSDSVICLCVPIKRWMYAHFVRLLRFYSKALIPTSFCLILNLKSRWLVGQVSLLHYFESPCFSWWYCSWICVGMCGMWLSNSATVWRQWLWTLVQPSANVLIKW